jgi:dihydrodipicolinate synthase/N-acetylneuraminate lyase
MSQQSKRESLVATMFPTGVPSLWCPPVTHFGPDGSLDRSRTASHLAAIAPYAKGIMVPGSTGEGWDLDDLQIRELLATVLQLARHLDLRVLIGVLRRDVSQMLAVIEGTVSWLCDESGQNAGMAAMLDNHVVGFTVCPPSGPELSQADIRDGLAAVLELGHPTALYQLPQVTGNEMSPETVAQLADQYPHFYLLKDTSGEDRVAVSQVDLQGVFLVRGAEGKYDRWLRRCGGPYDGYLLSTANCFARELAEIMELSDTDPSAATRLADRVENTVNRCFQIVENYPAGNPFANANKVVDQVMAFGNAAVRKPPPYLHGGVQLPLEFVQQACDVLAQYELLPAAGYC